MNHYQDQSLTSILKANIAYFSPSYRPLGGIFYRPLFAGFGLNPLPFRIACFTLLILNLGLAWWLARLLTHSTEIAALSTLLGAFHPRLVDLYWSTGTIYDILCLRSSSPRSAHTSLFGPVAERHHRRKSPA